MAINQNELSWIVVKDLKQARHFFKETLGFEEMSYDEKYGWAEFAPEEGGTRLGVSIVDKNSPIDPGSNAVMTFSVDDLDATKDELSKKGVHFVGDIMEVPGHVRLQLFTDLDGNYFQLVEMIGPE